MSSDESSQDSDYSPRACDKLVSNALLDLSPRTRNDTREEIHGVRSLAKNETPELMRESLESLVAELNNDEIIPVNKKRAYLISQRFTNPTSYVSTDDFCLRFLRLEIFNVTKAARRLVEFLEAILRIFGEYALRRPVRLCDFPKHELVFLRKGHLQFLPFRDRSGRRILVIFPNKDYELVPPEVKAKIFLYICWTAGNDVDTQRSGLVYSVWFDSGFSISGRKGRYILPAKLRELSSVRTSAIHICSPDKPMFRWGRYIVAIRIKRQNRSKMIVHLGSDTELRYALQSFGIPSGDIPISNGKIRVANMRHWLNTREALEEGGADILECPLVNDVVFRQGKTLTGHAGNGILRGLIELKNDEQESDRCTPSRMKRKNVVDDLMNEIQAAGGRFLTWNEKGWWSELKDQKQILSKIEYKVGEYRKSVRVLRKTANRQVHADSQNSGTHMFQSLQSVGAVGPMSWADACGVGGSTRQRWQSEMMNNNNNNISNNNNNRSNSINNNRSNSINNNRSNSINNNGNNNNNRSNSNTLFGGPYTDYI